MNPQRLHQIRAAVVAKGLTPASWIPEASQGRVEEASIRPARLVEGTGMLAIPVGPAEPWAGPVAFLDGTQRYDIVAHAGAAPLVIATVGAAVRERRDRRLRTVVHEVRGLAVGRAEALARAGDALVGLEQITLADDGPVHPIRDLMAVRRAVDQERGRLEVKVGGEYHPPEDGWLVVDGSLSESPAWAASPRTIGIAKSHSILPFEGADLEQYLGLPCGHRSPVFAPAKSQVAPVYSWALRLWPWQGHDLFYGLVRVEARPGAETVTSADRISRWIMAERSPLSAPDARWDRLLYGVHDVESYLRAAPGRGPVPTA
jgi:hypothetical protein